MYHNNVKGVVFAPFIRLVGNNIANFWMLFLPFTSWSVGIVGSVTRRLPVARICYSENSAKPLPLTRELPLRLTTTRWRLPKFQKLAPSRNKSNSLNSNKSTTLV